ncbi:MAG: hypothetical protein ABR567_22295 [Myxococcales bacterium]|nr:hypothetical protein [Myxococcales bacterium]
MRLLLLSVLLACAHMKDDKTVCAESRNVRCITRTTCAMDRDRGCQVCRCEAFPLESRGDGRMPPPIPPDPDDRR